MDKQDPELIKKIREQFDSAPYPRIPLEKSPKEDYNFLFIHNLLTPYYLRNQKVINTEGKIILDAGCGSGYKSLALAIANPGAKIIGIDISEESAKLAKHRLEYHGFENHEFYYPISIEEIPSLGLEFDYINCDEVLYLLPEPTKGLQAMKSVLKPDGIIRANLHSSLQRTYFYRAQEIFKMMGLMDENPRELEIELARQVMVALKDGVLLKARTFVPDKANDEEWMLMNYLFQGDKGYTIPEMFAALKAADLEFISMVNWRQWELMELFANPEDLPAFLEISLPEISIEERLHLFELIHPINRLLDFWCGHPNQGETYVPVGEWELSDWQRARVHLHPQLRTPQVKEKLIECIHKHKPFEISAYISLPTTVPITIDSSRAAYLLPLWEGAQPFSALVERALKIRPLDLATLEPVDEKRAFDEVKELLSQLEPFMYVLLEPAVSEI
ncbi:MAG: class I SAM-dependent methyltransferase [Oscillatoriaceae bacterium SKW80]|nr:class I SAM-dependent methyltransferase [Oscillatoriaceae bacterium SKYG93]MCX8121863.1 class I SAM-dependent methyltransferase [Oscillatoriaceae bacterium SKW80]MDW8454624.1 class I SAM-dependent methyltransferase [Oscillatoriaceae cyanobacterium SKYGB_i_bin93]HIK27434.1 class I SAM-dependent methyltransferase [Oscillatoriaceae cyanobacterium M7585_C2015_266]